MSQGRSACRGAPLRLVLAVLAALACGGAAPPPCDPEEDALAFSLKPPEACVSVEEAFQLGSLCFHQDQFEECVAYMDAALAMDLDQIEANLLKGLALVLLQKKEQGLKQLAIYAEEDPRRPEGYNLVGRVLFDYGLYPEAEVFFRKALAYAPDDPGLYNNLGSVLVRLGAIDQARSAFEQGLARDATVPELHINLGIVYFTRRDLRAAEEEFLTAIEMNEVLGIDDPVAYANLGDVYLEITDLAGAVDAYRRSLAADSDQPDVLTRLGMALQLLGETRLAAEEYEAAIAAGGEPPAAHMNLARLFLDEGRIRAAVRELRAAAAMTRGRDPEPLQELGRVLDAMGETAPALACFRRAFEAGSRDTVLLAVLSRLCEERGEAEDAVSYFDLLEEQRPFDGAALFAVARRCTESSLDRIRDLDRGLSIFRGLAERTGWRHAGVLAGMAAAYACLGDFRSAATVQQSAIVLIPPDSPILPGMEERLRRYQAGQE